MNDQIKESLVFIIRITSNTNEMADFLRPFLHKIDNPHLTHFHGCLQHKKTAFYAFSTVINEIVKDCKTNEELREIMERLIQTFS